MATSKTATSTSKRATPPAAAAAAPKGSPADQVKVGQVTAEGTVVDSVYDPIYGWLNVTNTGSVLQYDGHVPIGADQYGGSYLGYQLSLKGDDPNQYKLESENPQTFGGTNAIKDNGNGTYTLTAKSGATYTFGNTKAYDADKAAQSGTAATAAANAANNHTEALIMDSLADYGFTAAQKASIQKQVSSWIQQGYAADDITDTLLPTTAAYKARFPLNATRVAEGQAPLTPSEYDQWATQNKQSEKILQASLEQWGFTPAQQTALMKQVDAWVVQGYAPSDITNSLLPQTKQYEQRFPANAALIKQGYAALSPADYMSTEQAMRQAAQAAGIPNNAYDPNKLIAANVSPSEFSDRITQAYEVINSNPQVAKEFETYYGIKANQLTAYILDPKQNTFALNTKGQVAQLGAAGQQVGQAVTKAQATTMQAAGVNASTLQNGLGQVQQESQLTGNLVGQSQKAFNSNQILSAASGVNVGTSSAQATQQIQHNAQVQKNLFAGLGSVGSNSQGEQGIGSVAR